MRLKIDSQPELVFYCGSTLLEGPCWDSDKQIIYCVSIDQHYIYGINTLNGDVRSYPTLGPVGCVVIDDNGMLVSAEKEGIYQIDPNTQERFLIAQFENDGLMRYNDGKLDPSGRFLVGTKGDLGNYSGKGKLFSYDGTTVKTIISGTTISNGLGFSQNGEKMYFIDTPTKKVGQYQYKLDSGDAIFERYVVEIAGKGWPDGMCVDIDDMIWVAEWDGGQVCKWNPDTGEKLLDVKLPCQRVTSCCLGGENLDYLFITTAKDSSNKEPFAGGLFRLKIR